VNRAAVARLRKAIQQTPPEQFDYRFHDSQCGCVMAIIDRSFRGVSVGDAGIAEWLEVEVDEAAFITGDDLNGDPGLHFIEMTDEEAKGENGKAEALRRLAVIEARYPAHE
jgi:hypothetical protein